MLNLGENEPPQYNFDDAHRFILEELIKDLEEAIKNDYWDHFAKDGFFWGQQFQEEAVKEYKAQDEEFLKWAKEIDYSVYLNSLHEPKHYNITCLPYTQKIEIKDKLVESDHDFSQVINFMMQQAEPKHYNKLLKEIERTDIVRHEKFSSVFPEMKTLFQGVLV